MKKRLIAILALASLSWSSAPAMELAMQRHMHHAQGTQPASTNQHHSCCPNSHSSFVPEIFATPAPAPMPCEDLPCCVRKAPDNSPALPDTVRISRPDSARLTAKTPTDLDPDFRVRTAPESLDTGPFQLLSIRSTVLRN